MNKVYRVCIEFKYNELDELSPEECRSYQIEEFEITETTYIKYDWTKIQTFILHQKIFW
jgi:hypothetical protein